MMGAKVSLLDMLEMLQAPFRAGMQARWFYDEELCPCCRTRKLDTESAGKTQLISLNGYFYRPRALLIMYPLCLHCCPRVMREKDQGPMHRAIEVNLVAAYNRYMALRES